MPFLSAWILRSASAVDANHRAINGSQSTRGNEADVRPLSRQIMSTVAVELSPTLLTFSHMRLLLVSFSTRCGAGTNNIPTARCTELGIPVFNTPGANANAVMELVICGLFLGSRRVVDGINHMKSLGEQGLAKERVGKWARKR